MQSTRGCGPKGKLVRDQEAGCDSHDKNRGIYEVFRGSKEKNLNFESIAFAPLIN
jgi:hypothetical protein